MYMPGMNTSVKVRMTAPFINLSPVGSGRGAVWSLTLPPEADEPLCRVRQLNVRLVGHQVEHTLPERLVEAPPLPRVRKKTHG